MKGLCLTIIFGTLSAIFSICKAQEVKIDFNLTYDKSKNEMTLTVSNMGDKDVLLLNQVSETLNGGFIFLYYKTFDGISASRSLPLIDYDSKNSRRILQKELPAGQQFIQVYNLKEKPKFVWLSLIGRTIILNWNICIRNLFSSCLVVHKIGKLFYFAER